MFGTSLGCPPTALTYSNIRHRRHGGGDVKKAPPTTKLQNPGTVTTLELGMHYSAKISFKCGHS